MEIVGGHRKYDREDATYLIRRLQSPGAGQKGEESAHWTVGLQLLPPCLNEHKNGCNEPRPLRSHVSRLELCGAN